jgi:hypothetical protein
VSTNESAQADDPHDKPSPRWARWITIGSVVAAVIALVITVAMAGPSAIFHQLIGIGPWFVLVIAIEALGTLSDAAALKCCVGEGSHRPTYWDVVRAQVAGRSISLVTPLGSLGEVTKTTMLMKDVSAERAIAAVARWNLTILGISLAAIVIGAPVCAATLDLPPWLSWTLYVGSAAAAAALIVGVALIRRGMVSTLVAALGKLRLVSKKRRAAWKKQLRNIDQHLRGRGHRRIGMLPAAWLVASRLLVWINVYVILHATGNTATLGTMAAMATAGTVISYASTIVPMGLGISEGGNAALFAALGQEASLGVTLVMTRRMIQLLYAAFGLSLVATHGTIQRAKAFQAARGSKRAPARAVKPAGPAAASYPRAS